MDDKQFPRRTCPGGYDYAGHDCDAQPACPPGYPRLTALGWILKGKI
jgi:hypothetical protein